MNMNKSKMHRLQLQDHSFLRQVSGNNPLVAGLTNFGTESTGLNRKKYVNTCNTSAPSYIQSLYKSIFTLLAVLLTAGVGNNQRR